MQLCACSRRQRCSLGRTPRKQLYGAGIGGVAGVHTHICVWRRFAPCAAHLRALDSALKAILRRLALLPPPAMPLPLPPAAVAGTLGAPPPEPPPPPLTLWLLLPPVPPVPAPVPDVDVDVDGGPPKSEGARLLRVVLAGGSRHVGGSTRMPCRPMSQTSSPCRRAGVSCASVLLMAMPSTPPMPLPAALACGRGPAAPAALAPAARAV